MILYMAHIRWQDNIPNTEGLRIRDTTGVEAFLMIALFCWTRHAVHMNDNRIPKTCSYSQLEHGVRGLGGQRKRYKDVLKANMKACGMAPKDLGELSARV